MAGFLLYEHKPHKFGNIGKLMTLNTVKKKVESAILLGVPIIKASVLDYDRVLPHHIWFN